MPTCLDSMRKQWNHFSNGFRGLFFTSYAKVHIDSENEIGATYYLRKNPDDKKLFELCRMLLNEKNLPITLITKLNIEQLRAIFLIAKDRSEKFDLQLLCSELNRWQGPEVEDFSSLHCQLLHNIMMSNHPLPIDHALSIMKGLTLNELVSLGKQVYASSSIGY